MAADCTEAAEDHTADCMEAAGDHTADCMEAVGDHTAVGHKEADRTSVDFVDHQDILAMGHIYW